LKVQKWEYVAKEEASSPPRGKGGGRGRKSGRTAKKKGKEKIYVTEQRTKRGDG